MAKGSKRAKRTKSTRPKRRRIELEVDLNILAVDSNFDAATKAAYEYRQEHVYPYLESQGFTLLRCQGSLARRIYVAPEARRPDVICITGVGHGLYDTYFGDYLDPIFTIDGYQPEEAAEKVVHLLSCQTAARLGPDFVAHGCRAYFGYDENFSFPLNYAETFFACDSEIDLAFADGLTAEEVYDRAIALYNDKITELENAGHDYWASVLEFDRDHLRAPSVDARWGDQQATLN